jgi:hypothetical protein
VLSRSCAGVCAHMHARACVASFESQSLRWVLPFASVSAYVGIRVLSIYAGIRVFSMYVGIRACTRPLASLPSLSCLHPSVALVRVSTRVCMRVKPDILNPKTSPSCASQPGCVCEFATSTASRHWADHAPAATGMANRVMMTGGSHCNPQFPTLSTQGSIDSFRAKKDG